MDKSEVQPIHSLQYNMKNHALTLCMCSLSFNDNLIVFPHLDQTTVLNTALDNKKGKWHQEF